MSNLETEMLIKVILVVGTLFNWFITAVWMSYIFDKDTREHNIMCALGGLSNPAVLLGLYFIFFK